MSLVSPEIELMHDLAPGEHFLSRIRCLATDKEDDATTLLGDGDYLRELRNSRGRTAETHSPGGTSRLGRTCFRSAVRRPLNIRYNYYMHVEHVAEAFIYHVLPTSN